MFVVPTESELEASSELLSIHLSTITEKELAVSPPLPLALFLRADAA
jgi:hypothetical protein